MQIKYKTLALILLMLFFINTSVADEGKKVLKPKPAAYRLGTTDEVEARFHVVDSKAPIEATSKVLSASVTENSKKMSFADANLKMLSGEISQELGVDKDEMFAEISILWAGAVKKSETIRFAIYKLSNPDAEKPNQNVVKKIISPLAGLTTLAGAGVGDPILSSSAFLGGTLLDIFSKDAKELNYKYTKVNDADMIVLIRKIDDMQKNIINYYCDYMRDRTVLIMRSEILEKRKALYDSMQNSSNNELLIVDAYYRDAADACSRAQMKFLATRATLEQLVGNETLVTFEAAFSDENDNSK